MEDFDIQHIQAAAERLSGYITRTPIIESPMLDAACGCNVYVKAESLQRTGSFKIRGALNKMLSLDADSLGRGVVTYSAGNHGQGVAAGARLIGCPAVIVLPTTAAAIKIESCRWWGAEIVLYDPDTQEREQVARQLMEARGLTFIPPFDDYDIMAGQGSAGLEICEQLEARGVAPDAILVNCSGGGLASGVITAVKSRWPRIEAHIVEPAGFEKMARSLASGVPQRNDPVPKTVMDGIAGPVAGTRPLHVLLRHEVKGLGVNDEEALRAVSTAFRLLKLVVEPGGAASLAALLENKADLAGKTVVAICSGGNVDPGVYARALAGQ
ncbi:threonine ammonia-lyase [Cupriavidus necator]|uniref:threonine ammonia-lyase n=1 Tax=Cupriavidus necator TaxID=106590 RepID=UPI0005B3AB19|nr:threonine/serine dehydratase [Cupriavidus necator]